MFKKESSFSNEIMRGMQSNLIARKVENQYSFEKVAKAIDLLNTAADIFDDAGLKAESEGITQLLEKIAEKQVQKNAAFGDDLTLKDLTPEDTRFFGQLSPHIKDSLARLVKHKDDAKGIDEFAQESDWEEVSESDLMAKDHLSQAKKKV